MSQQVIKTNNDYYWLQKKIDLRKKYIPKNTKILECYGGNGVIYKNLLDHNLKINSIDINNYKRVNLKGDNIKWLSSIDLDQYSAIDLDSYGFAAKQLEIIIKKKYKVHIFLTCIASGIGNIPFIILEKNGYTKQMIKKAQTLFTKNPFQKIKNYLSNLGVKEINYYGDNRKYYIHFELK